MSKTITVYSTKSCPNCIKIKDVLSKEKIDFIVNEDMNKIRDVAIKNNIMTVPILQIRDEKGTKYYNYNESRRVISELSKENAAL